LQGSNPITVTAVFTFTGGTLAGSGLPDTLTIGAGATAFGGEVINNRTVRNLGSWSFLADNFIGLQNAVVVDNQGSLTFGDGTVYDYGGSGGRVLSNGGSLVKSSGSGSLNINVVFDNHGTVQLDSGSLRLVNSGSDTGSYAVPSGTALQFLGGTRVLNAGAVLGGAGDVNVTGSALTLSGTYAITGTTTINGGIAHFETAAGAVTFPTLTLSSGTLDGRNALTVARAFTFTGGTLAGSGLTDTFTIAASATAYDGELIVNRTVHNLGSWSFPANSFTGLQNAVVWDNQGSLTFGDGTVYDYGGSGSRLLNNAGNLVKSSGSGNLNINVPFDNHATVQLNSGGFGFSSFRQLSGQLALNGGILSGNSIIFDGGLLTGTGTVNGNVVNNGALVSPGASAGALTIAGNYQQGLAGTLHIELGGTVPAITFDVLNVTNQATLSGTLDVALINGFTPTRADSFPVLTFGSHSGQFAIVNNPISATHPVTYADHSVVLGVVPPTFVLPGDGRLSGISLVSNANRAQTLGLAYDVIGRQTGLRNSGYSTYTLAYAYDAAGRLATRTTSEGHTPNYSYAYDAAGQITHIAMSNTTATTMLLQLDYTYDAAGNITGITSSRDGAMTYSYDALNRVTGISSPGFNTTYAYDAVGNRTSANGVTFNYDAAGRLSSSSDGASYTYDAAGNLLTRTRNGQTDTFQWTGQGRLARITYADSTFSVYAYDAAGRRIRQRRRDGTLTYYTYIGSNLAQELDASGNVIASYTYDGLDRPISMWRRDAGPSGQTYFYLLDHLGDVLDLVDENGVTAATYRYDPWGNVISSTGSITNPLRFAAREWDEDSRLYYDRARYYDPIAGRFISRDRLGINGGLNHYAYVGNNPVRFGDPLGLLTDTQCQVIQNMLEFEQEHGTWETARKFSNTPGFYDEQTPMGDVFDNGDTDTPYGVVDLDWFTDILAFGGGGSPIEEAFGIPNASADIMYYWGKTIWNLTRDSTGQGAGAAPYEDYKETRALELLNSYIDTYAELFPDSFMETACPLKCMGE
jgi:RHS repeat-associated protein